MKQGSLSILILIFFACSINESVIHTNAEVSSLSPEELEIKKQELKLLFNHEVAKEYLRFLDEKETILAIGNFGWTEVRKCWREIPEIGKFKDEFEKADKDFLNFICSKDERMQVVLDKWENRSLGQQEWARTKSLVYSAVNTKYPKEYKQYFGERQESLRICNYKTLEYLVKDYHEQGQLFPLGWISSYHMKQILTDDFVKNLNAKTDGFGFNVIEMN